MEKSAGAVVWFTGLSGSGKSTLARFLAVELTGLGLAIEHLDGDEVRELFPATGFSRNERIEHVKRIGYTASLLAKHGVTVLVSLISPHREARQFSRELSENFIEVFVATPLGECERRDPKGLYGLARAGELKCFTGVSDQYEVPLEPEIFLDTTGETIAQSGRRLVQTLMPSLANPNWERATDVSHATI